MLYRGLLVVATVGVGLSLGACASSGHKGRESAGGNDYVSSYLGAARADLRDGKVRLINDVMRMNESQTETFWEIYREYEEEYFALGDRRMQMERALSERILTGTLDDKASTRIAAGFLDLRDEMNALLRRYHARISEELSPLHGAQFLQIEHRMATVVDMVVSSELPMIRGE